MQTFNFRRCISRFSRDDSGAVFVFFAMSLVAIVGMGAMTLDLGRQMRMDSELQEMADAAALAAAYELDGRADSIQRAIERVNVIMEPSDRLRSSNFSLFASNNARVVELRFAKEWSELIPDPVIVLDPQPGTTSATPEEQASVGWVQAVTTTGSAPTFFAGVIGGTADMEATGRATAGTGFVACDVTPLRLCSSNPLFYDNDDLIGTQFMLKSNNQTPPPINGDFGITDPPHDPNGNHTLKHLATDYPRFCYTQGVSVSPGAQTSKTTGLNVRFAMYQQGTGNVDLKAIGPPAPNVTKGYSGNSCNFQPNQNSIDRTKALPRDTMGADGIGLGDWKTRITTYMDHHHGTKTEAEKTQLLAGRTRYDLYLAELGITREDEDTPIFHDDLAGLPFLPAEAIPPDECKRDSYLPSRRVIYVAVVDCSNNTGNATPPRRSTRYLKFFLTEPVLPANQGSIVYAELVDIVRVNDGSGKLKAIVQLYPNP